MNPTTTIVDQAEAALRLFFADTREDAARLLEMYGPLVEMRKRSAAAADEVRYLVLDRFPASEPPAMPGLDFLPAVVADADLVVASLDVEVAPKVLTGEVTSPFGLCSGLAADKRDNTCTNFAAEYVSYQAEHWSGMTCRRLCTSCADAAPDVYSRKPLTHGPGGVPVERAS